jgi:hypothetical protein
VAPWQRLQHFSHEMSSLPWTHPRAIGWLMLRAAAATLPPALCLQPATVNIAMAMAAAGLLLCRPPMRGLPGLSAGVAFLLWVGASAAVARTRGAPVTISSAGIMYVWTSCLVAQIGLSDRRALRAALLMSSALMLASVLVAAAQVTIGLGGKLPFKVDPHGPRGEGAVGFLDVHLTFGYAMCMLTLMVSLAAAPARLPRWLGPCAAVVGALGIFLSHARMAYAAIACGVGAAIAGRGWRRMMMAAGAVVAIVILAVISMRVAQPDRLNATVRGEDGRWPIWRTSIAIIRDYPLLGTGSQAAFKLAYLERYEANSRGAPNEFPDGAPHAHNSMLSLASRNGIPAVVFYLAIWFSIARAAFRERGHAPASWSLVIGAMVVAAVGGMFEDTAGRAMPSFALFTTLGAGLALAGHAEARRTPSAASQA